MTEFEKRNYFNEIAWRWDSIPRPSDMGGRVADFCRRACPADAQRILDAGSGTGLLGPHLVRRLGGDFALVETDFALDMLRRSAAKRPDARTRRVCSDALRLPFPDACFDVVLCYGILPHLGDPRDALAELLRVVCPGGRLSVGHLMGSGQLNAMHRSIGGPVGGDTLPGAPELVDILTGLGVAVDQADDLPSGYFVSARREAA